MYIVLTFFLIFLSIASHELGHAVAMIKLGVKVKEIGFGIRIPYLPSLIVHFKNFPPIKINHLMLFAYVQPKNEQQIFSLPYKEQAIIYGSGIIGNLYFLILLIVVGVLSKINNIQQLSALIVIPIAILIGLLIWILRKVICCLIVPVGGLFGLVFLVNSIFKSPTNTLGGPVGLVNVVSKISTSWLNSLAVAGAVTISLIIINMLPLEPLDGGKTINAFIKERWNEKIVKFIRYLSVSLFLCLILLSFFSDIITCFKK